MAETIRIEIPIETIDNTDPAMSNVTKRLNDLGKAATSAGSNMDSARTKVSRFDDQAEKTQKSLSKWAKEKYEVMLEAKDKITPVLQQIGNGIKGIAGRTWNVTMRVLDFVTSPVRGIINLLRNPILQTASVLGVSIGLADTVNTYKDFETAMSQVQAISGATSSQLEQLTEKAKQMGATTKFTAEESAEAFNYMAMAGWKTTDMMSGIEGVLNLAAASGEDLGTTSDIVTDALTAFSMEAADAGHFSDVLAAAAANANTTVSGMGETFKYAGSMAGAMGYSIEDVALATGLMANSGIKATMAGTSLNSIFTRLSTNASGAADALSDLGIQFFTSEGNARDWSDVMDELRAATANMNAEQKSNLANTIAGMEAQKGLLAILNASEEDYRKLAEAINSADGAAKGMSDTMMDNLQGSITLLQSAVDGVQISFGERLAPYVRSVADWLTSSMPAIQQGLDEFMDWVDGKADELKDRIDEMTSSEEWANADFFGKVKIAWDEMIAEPFSEWWESTGRAKVAKIAGDVGGAIGSGLKFGMLALLGIDISSSLDEGASVGASFARGFSEGFDASAIVSKLQDALGNMLSNAAKILPGGEAPDLSSFLSAGLLMKIGSPLFGIGKGAFSIGKTLLGTGAGGTSLMGSLLGSASMGTGLLGKSAMFAVNMGAGNLAGGASLSTGALAGVGAAGIGGGIAAGATLISGALDAYKAIKSENGDEAKAYGDSAAWKFGGVAAGAAAGAAIGSIIPGIGTAVGALVGAGVGGIAGWIRGNKIKEEYQANVEEMQKEAEKAQKVFQATGMDIDNVRFKNEALTAAMNDSAVSAEEFAAMFQEECANVMTEAFGDIHLSLTEVKKLASEITFGDMSKSLDEFAEASKNADDALDTMQRSVTSLKKENWKVGLGMELSESERDNYRTAIDNFVSSAQAYIEDNHYEATVALQLLMNGDGDTTGLDSMYEGFKTQTTDLGKGLSEAIETALTDGIIDVDEMAIIEEYQQKISNITNKISEAKSEAQLQAIGIKYSGAELDAESFQAMQEELAAYSQAAQENFDEALTLTLTNLNLELAEGAITQEQYDAAVREATEGYQAQLNDVSVRVNNFNLDAIATAYEDELNEILPYFEGTTQEKLQQAINNAMISHPDTAAWTTADVIGWLGLDSIPTEVANPLAVQLIQAAQANTSVTKEQLIESYKECIPTADEIYDAIDWSSFTFGDKDAIMALIDPMFGQEQSFGVSDKTQSIVDYYTNSGYDWESAAKAISENISSVMRENLDPQALQQVMDTYFSPAGTLSGARFNAATAAELSSGSELYRSSAYNAINSAFADPFSVDARISIMPSYNLLTMPSIPVSKHAAGGYVSGGPSLSWLAEEGYGEYVIPTNPARRSDALSLYRDAGRALGVDEQSFPSAPATAGGSEGKSTSIQVNVNVSPEFTLNNGGKNEEDIVQTIRRHLREIADELGGEIADKLGEVFSNMPLKEA